MSRKRFVGLAIFFGIASSLGRAQISTPLPPTRKNSTHGHRTGVGTPPVGTPSTSGGPGGVSIPGSTGTRSTTNRREPCWEVAGISKATMEQRRALSLRSRQEVEGVCADAALSEPQKLARIREIHQQERQQIDGLISPAQREAMHACTQERGGGMGGGGNLVGGGGEGPCGVRPAGGKHRLPSVPLEDIPKE
jgi:hypothetical protein